MYTTKLQANDYAMAKRKKCQVTRRKELFYHVTSGSNVTRDVDYQQIANDNIANQNHGFTTDYGKFMLIYIIIHQTHYEKSDLVESIQSITIACELDMINTISAADIAFLMSSSTPAWLLSPLECSSETKWLRFCF